MSTTLGKNVQCGHLTAQTIRLSNEDLNAKLAALQTTVDRLAAMRPIPSRLHGTYLLVSPDTEPVWASSLHHNPDPTADDGSARDHSCPRRCRRG